MKTLPFQIAFPYHRLPKWKNTPISRSYMHETPVSRQNYAKEQLKEAHAMSALWSMITQCALSLALIIGALLAIWLVYKHKDQLLSDSNDS